MSYKNRSQANRRGMGRLLTTMLAICLPVIAAAFFSGSFFKLSSAHVAHAAGHHASPEVTVSITSSGFNPNSISINPGTQVTWTNNTSSRVRVRDSQHNLFDSDDFNPGGSFSYTFVSSGTIGVDEERNGFHMTVTVTGTPGPTGTAGATGTAGTTGTPGATGTVGTPGPTNTPGAGQLHQINIFNDDGFDPTNITINSGDTLRWTNYDNDTHTSTSPGNWNSGDLNTGQSFQVTLINNGTYSYFCAYHSQMQGTITVVGGPTATPQVTSTPAGGTVDVSIQNFAFTPRDVTITVGSTIRWTNLDSTSHTSTSPGNWDSGNLGTNQTFSRTFNTVGTYSYFCAYHSGMTGTVTVTNGGGSTATPGASQTAQITQTAQASQTAQVTNTPVPGGTVDVSIQNFAFTPRDITINVGSTVRWTNNDPYAHTSTSPGNWDSGTLNQGQTFSQTFTTAGTYSYFCAFHSGMTGTVTVTNGGGSTATPQLSQTAQVTQTAQATQTMQGTATSTSVPQATGTAVPQVVAVRVENYAYLPATINITAGTTVRWTNFDTDPHTVTSPSSPRVLNSGTFTQGQTFSYTFNTPGTYEYFCEVHGPYMTGYVIVGAAPTATATRVAGQIFNDVFPNEYFYTPVNWLVSHNIVSGYSDGTFRPYNNTTRAQVTKMVVLGEGWQQINPANPTFTDVAPGSTFYQFIETAVQHGIITGYSDRTFRPNADVTRGQITKIVVSGRGWMLNNPTTPTFADVARGSTFYEYIETAAQHAILGGYSDGTFRPGANATRGQVSKILYNALTSSR